MKKLVRWLKRNVLVVLAFLMGVIARGIIDDLGVPYWAIVVGYVALLVPVLVFNHTPKPEPVKPPSIPDLSKDPVPSLADWLAKVATSDVVPRDQLFIMHPDTLRKTYDLTIKPLRGFGAPWPDKAHLPGCMRRHSPAFRCICGGQSQPCPNEWWSDQEGAVDYMGGGRGHGMSVTDPGHTCTLVKVLHGSLCVCWCGATTPRSEPMCSLEWANLEGRCELESAPADGSHHCVMTQAYHARTGGSCACACGVLAGPPPEVKGGDEG